MEPEGGFVPPGLGRVDRVRIGRDGAGSDHRRGQGERRVLLRNNLEGGPGGGPVRHRGAHGEGLGGVPVLHLDALSSMVGLKVDFDLQITIMASSLYRLLADRIGREYAKGRARRLFRMVVSPGP